MAIRSPLNISHTTSSQQLEGRKIHYNYFEYHREFAYNYFSSTGNLHMII